MNQSFGNSPLSLPTPTPTQATGDVDISPARSITKTPLSQKPDVFPDSPVNMRHMHYLSHFLLDTRFSCGWFPYTTVEKEGNEKSTMLPFFMNSALEVPYLMHITLALAALHLGHCDEADVLQTRALELFNSTAILETTSETCVPQFIFASMLGVYMLASASNSRNANGVYADFLDRFVTYLDIHKGVRAVTGRCWHLLEQSALAPILNPFQTIGRSTPQPGHCDKLFELLQTTAADSNGSVLAACEGAVQQLQWAFSWQISSSSPDLQLQGEAEDASSHDRLWMGYQARSALFAWPSTLSAQYSDLLMKRRPEALIILAYYGVLLNWHRELWVVGDSGQRLINSITSILGPYWRPWLEWPNSIIQGTA